MELTTRSLLEQPFVQRLPVVRNMKAVRRLARQRRARALLAVAATALFISQIPDLVRYARIELM